MRRSFAVAAVLVLAVSALVVIPWGDEAACESSAQSTDQATGMYRVTGGGQMSGCMVDCGTVTGVDAVCTIGFTAEFVGDPLPGGWHEARGEIHLVDNTNGVTFQGTVDEGQPTPPFSNCVYFMGEDGRITTSGGTFDVTSFWLKITEYDCVDVFVDYDGSTVGWVLSDLEKGNITFHKPKKGEPPPPPPGPGGPFPACDLGTAEWNAASGDQSGRVSIASGSFLNVNDSDDLYLVLSIPPLAPHSTNWSDPTVAWELCCWGLPDPTGPQSMGATIKWCDITIPSGATEMKVTFEYRADIADYYCCSLNPCAEDGQNWHGMGEPWDSEGAPLGWGMGMVNFGVDPWMLSTWGSEADLFSGHDYAGSYTDYQYARKSRSEEVVVWTVPIASAPNYVDESGNVLLHMCGGGWGQMYIDQAIIEFTIP